MRLIIALSLFAVDFAARPHPALARPASTGIYTEAGIGGAHFVGPKSTFAATGPSFELRVGYDLFSWLSVGANIVGTSHEATLPTPPAGEYFQTYTGHGEARLGFRWRSIGLFVDGGAGITRISSNVLQSVNATDPGQRNTISFSGGGGLEYQLANRHHAFGLAASVTVLPDFANMKRVGARAYFRYTY